MTNTISVRIPKLPVLCLVFAGRIGFVPLEVVRNLYGVHDHFRNYNSATICIEIAPGLQRYEKASFPPIILASKGLWHISKNSNISTQRYSIKIVLLHST